jgi:arsenate reductase
VKLLDEEGIDFRRVDYFVDALSRKQLSALLNKAGLTPREVLRKRDKAYRELGLGEATVSDDRVLDAIVEHPGLLQRPIVEHGGRAVLARPVERVRELLSLPSRSTSH